VGRGRYSSHNLGAFIGGLTVAFSDKWSGSRIMPRWWFQEL
jgi:hypothetical protein